MHLLNYCIHPIKIGSNIIMFKLKKKKQWRTDRRQFSLSTVWAQVTTSMALQVALFCVNKNTQASHKQCHEHTRSVEYIKMSTDTLAHEQPFAGNTILNSQWY